MIDDRLEKMQAMAKRFGANGTVNQLTVRQIDMLVLNAKLEVMDAERIKSLREKERISQAVLAGVLNMSCESVQKWEQGKSKPRGSALRLLNIIEQKGIAAVI